MSAMRDSSRAGRDAQLSSPQKSCLDEMEAMSESERWGSR